MRLNSEVRTWTDTNGDLVPQDSEIGPGRGTLDRGANVTLDPNVKWPSQWEYTVSLERQLLKTLGVTVSYLHRRYGDIYTTVNAALSPSDYTPVTITNPLDGTPFTVYNQNPATASLVNNVFKTSPDIYTLYNGFEVNFDKRMGNNFMLFGALTIASNKECLETVASSNPNDRINACGYTILTRRL